MPYDKQTWIDNDPTTPISAARLTHMENGIDLIDAHEVDTVDAHDASAISATTYGHTVGGNVQLSLQELEAQKARVGQVVDLTTNQTVAGVKTFTFPPIVPTPTTATQAANKSYVDGQVSAGVADGSVTDVKISSTANIAQSKILNLTTDIANRQLTSQKGSANGYMGLDSSTLAPVANLGTATADATKFLRGDRTWAVPPPTIQDDLQTFAKSGTLTTSTGVSRFRFPFAATIVGVTAAVGTAPTGASILVDVNRNGITIFTTQANRPTISAGATATSVEAIPNVTAIVTGDYLTVDVDQVGSSVAGSDLTVFIRYRQS